MKRMMQKRIISSKVKRQSQEKLLSFISEAGMLKRVPRSGWSVLGIKGAESVADHSFRCAVIGYLLAQMEQVSVYKVLVMTLFNDIQEARISDLHKMAQRYIESHSAEDKSFYEQVSRLPRKIKQELKDMHREMRNQLTAESVLARDADILECLLQAKEYHEQGFAKATKFMQQAPNFLRSKTAKRLWRRAKKTNLNHWWFGLSEFKR